MPLVAASHAARTNAPRPGHARPRRRTRRKAFRLGKFLQDWNNLRKSQATGVTALLELVAYGGEGVYFFIEQIVWCGASSLSLSLHVQKEACSTALPHSLSRPLPRPPTHAHTEG